MSKNIMDTQELSEIRALIGDIEDTPKKPPQRPARQQESESRRAPRQAQPEPQRAPRQAQPEPRRAPRQAEPELRRAPRQAEQEPRRVPRQTEPEPRRAAPRRAADPASLEATHPVPRHAARQSARPGQPSRQAAPQQQAQRSAPPPHAAAQSPGDAYNLDEILSEVSGVVERGASEKAHDTQRPRARPVHREAPRSHPAEPQRSHPAEPQRSAAPPQKKPRVVPIRPQYEEEEDDDEYEEIDEREERREAKRARREAERERRRTVKEAKRVTNEEDEEIVLRQPRQAQATCARRAKSLGSRSLVVLLMALASLYLTLAPGFGMPLPKQINFLESPTITVLALLLIQFIAMFAGIDVVGLGFYNLFSAKPDRRSLVSVAMLASLLHGLTIILAPAWSAYFPYCAVSIVLLFAMMTEEKNRLSARCRVFKAVSLSENPILVYSHLDPDDRPRRAFKYQCSDNTEFLRELERPDYAERFSSIYVPLALAVAAVFSIISAFSNNDPSRFFLSFSVMLSVGAPLGILCAAGSPYKNVSRRLLGDGAAIAGARGAQRLRAAKEAVLNDTDLFPAGSISIQGITNYGIYTDEKLLAYAAAITNDNGLELGRVFAEELHRGYGRPVRATRILRYESGGISGDIGGDSVMLGTAAFLARMGVRVKETKNIENGVFIVVNSYPAGVFNLQYHPSAQAYGGIHTMKRAGVTPIIAATDFNISPAMISSLFELRQGAVGEVPTERAQVYQNPAYVEGDPPGALLSRNSITPYANVFLCADKLAGVVRSNLILGGFAGVSGMLIMFYLTYLAEFAAISPQNVLLYLLLWYIPVMFITYGTRRLD